MNEPPPAYETAASSNFSINNGSYNQQAQASSSNRIKYSEIKLFENAKERSRCEDLSDLFAIIKTTDALEAAYSRDSLSSSEYSEACFKLISQFKTSESALVGSGAIVSADEFIREFDIDCPRAYERLIKVGVPATVAHATHDQRADIVIVAETVQEFITAMDVIKLGQRAMDEIQPMISKLTACLGKVQGLPADFEGLLKLRLWLQKLNQMRADFEISESEARQLSLDLDNAYAAFHSHISKKGGHK